MGKEAINEDQLLQGLSDLEQQIAKGGDPLQSHPHDGGFATEGINIQTRAKKIQKAMAEEGIDIDLEKATKIAKQMDDDEDENEDENNNGNNKAYKSDNDEDIAAERLAAAAAEGEQFKKALVDAIDDPEVAEQFDVTPFLQGLVDTVGKAFGGTSVTVDALAKALIEESHRANAFDNKLAKAVVSIGNELRETRVLLQQVLEQPSSVQRKAVLHKADVVQPPLDPNVTEGGGGGNGDPLNTPLANVEYLKVQEALVQKCVKDKSIDMLLVTKFENTGGDFRVLPPSIIKSLEAELCPQH